MAGTPKRIPLAVSAENRDATTSKDAKIVNAYLEKLSDTEYHVIKRPGIHSVADQVLAPGNVGGVFNYLGVFFAITGGFLWVGGVSVGAVDTTGGRYWAVGVQGAIPKIVFANTKFMYYFDNIDGLKSAGSVQPYPTPMIPGMAYLDGTLYAGQKSGAIFGSKINDVTNWDPTNVIVAQIEPDNAVAVAKQLVYVIVFKQWTTEVFYDQGNAAGSPLGANQTAKLNFGCVNGNSVLDVDGSLFWLSATRSGSSQVLMMNNGLPTIVSDSHIEKLIEASNFSTVYAWCYKGEGHTFYIFTLPDINLTLAYDIREKTWSQWTDPNGNYVPVLASTFFGTAVFVQLTTNGNIYQMSSAANSDVGVPFPVDIYTPNFDAGVDRRKVISRLRFNGDQTPGSVLKVRCNDFDYAAGKWTNYRSVDMNRQRPFLDNCGTFYRRAYHIHHLGNVPFRLTSMDVDMDIGSL